MATFWSQLKILLWRNFLLKKRNKKQIVKEFFYPILLVLLLAVIKALVKPQTLPAISGFPTYSLDKYRAGFFGNKRVLVTPNTTQVRDIMSDVQQYLGNDLDYFDNMAAAEASYKAHPDDVTAGVIFYSTGDNFSYSIRVSYDDIASPAEVFIDGGHCRDADNGYNSWDCDANSYLITGFIWLQHAIDTVLVRQRSVNMKLPSVFVNMMPKPEFTPDLSSIQSVSSVYFVLAYSFFINFLCVNLVAEKELKIREGMRMMGLRDSVFWLSWGLIYTVVIAVETAIMTAIVVALSYFSRSSNVFIFYLLMFLYGLAIINLAFMVIPLFDKAQVAGIVTGFSTIVVSCLYFAVSMTRTLTSKGYHYSVPPGGLWAICLLAPVALALGIDQGIYLDNSVGMTFNTMSQGEFPMYAPFVMLVVDSVLYAVLAVYFDHVIPGEYGPRYPPWYFLMPSFYKQQKTDTNPNMSSLSSLYNTSQSNQEPSPDLETVTADLRDRAGLRIFNISKDFKADKKTVHAVKGFSLDIYEGQITSLLGHNGAGKTTLLNMLCGLTPPTSGSAAIYDMNVSISGDMERIRSMCGVCPQHNILYDDLTTSEHLRVFAGIKGVPTEDQESQVRRAMEDVDISDKADTFSRNLSGGQKRKLSVAMALIGDPKIVFLDEPTAGMDPFSRRHLWSLLQKSKHDRIILLTTHFMDEADILADRKAIISHGKLRCCGSSLFLKNRFGIGYHLNMVVEPNCDANQVTELLGEHVKGIELKRSHAKELAYTMPLTQVSNFSNMFSCLEEIVNGKTLAENLGIRSYGVSMTTLEEVFLKLGEEEEADDNSFKNHAFIPDSHSQTELPPIINASSGNSRTKFDNKPINESDPVQGFVNKPGEVNLTSQRFWTLLKIRFLVHKRNPLAVIFQVVLPVLFVTIGCVFNKIKSDTSAATSPKQLSLTNIASQYIASHTLANSPPLLVMDSEGESSSNEFISGINNTWIIQEVNQSVNLLDLPDPHFLGFYLHSWQVTQAYNMNFTALYNDTAVHSLPVLFNLLANNIYSTITNNTNIYINTSSLPWPSHKSIEVNLNTFFGTMILSLAFILITPGFSVHIVRDRVGKFRGQLRVAGISFNLYWSTIFTLNFITYLIPSVLCLIIVGSAQLPSLDQTGALVSLSLMFLTFIPSMILFAYIFSFGFDRAETCQIVMPTVILIISMAPYVAVSIVDFLGNTTIALIIHYVFVIIDPPYTLTGGLYYINRIYRKSVIENDGTVPFEKYFQPDSNILICILMRLGSVAYVKNLRKEFRKDNASCCNRGSGKDTVKVAVRNATFAVDSGEVFGLLGPNGAGKTTTLSMIIAETGQSKGKVMVAGHDVRSSLSQAFQALGYCPQHDALWEVITLREHIEFYALLRGLTKNNSTIVANALIESLKVEEHADKRSRNLSGGTRRKLLANNIYSTITNNTNIYINTSSLPWPSHKSIEVNLNTFFGTMILSLAFILITPGFSVHIVRDRVGKFRGQLRVAGISFNLYWSTIFTLNFITYLIPSVLCLIIVGSAQLPSLDQTGALVSLSLMFLTFIPSMILFAYIFSFGFDRSETCQIVMPTVILIISMAPYVAVSIVDFLGNTTIALIIHYVFVIIDPPYTLTGGLYYINRIYRKSVIENDGTVPFEKYFQPDSNILICILMPLVHLIWLYILLRIFDVRSTGGKARDALTCGKQSKVDNIPQDNQDIIENGDEDEDVKEERNRVTALDRNDERLGSVAYVKNLRKEFRKDNASCCNRGSGKDTVKVAVRNATFAVDSGEVFGLLGPNGAGKTTTLSMIIAETGQSKGKVMVAGHDVRSSLSQAFQALGYCPQHDALWEVITLREHIEFYALLRGLTKNNSTIVANALIESLKVEEHADKRSRNLSGGTRRKLSYTLSILGSPEIVLLDEPSTGMDPQSKRFFWDTISSSFRESNRGAILTTHYMEEADALCSRVAIMVNGKIECLGPTQHLKDKYGSGYLLEVKLKNTGQNMEEKMNSLERHLVALFPHASCMERFEERGQYKIPKQDVTSLAETFSSLEQTKQTHDIEEYSFSQSTLEQVFMDFAKKQHVDGDDTESVVKHGLQRGMSGEK